MRSKYKKNNMEILIFVLKYCYWQKNKRFNLKN